MGGNGGTGRMPDIDISGPDRQVGSLLSGEEVERLREAINWIRRHRGLRLKEIALDCEPGSNPFVRC